MLADSVRKSNKKMVIIADHLFGLKVILRIMVQLLTAYKMCTMVMRADNIVWANSVKKSIDTRKMTADNLCGLTD